MTPEVLWIEDPRKQLVLESDFASLVRDQGRSAECVECPAEQTANAVIYLEQETSGLGE